MRSVKEAGFKAIWGSGLTISAQFGVRDNNEASWTQVVDTLEFMADASDLPILLDGDTGYGNFNAVLFILFDIEVIFFLPWAVTFQTLGVLGFVEMVVFIAILLVGYIWVWKKGALEWE